MNYKRDYKFIEKLKITFQFRKYKHFIFKYSIVDIESSTEWEVTL